MGEEQVEGCMDEGPEGGSVKLKTTGAYMEIVNATEHSSKIYVHETRALGLGLFPNLFG